MVVRDARGAAGAWHQHRDRGMARGPVPSRPAPPQHGAPNPLFRPGWRGKHCIPTATLQPSAPAVLPGDPDRVEVAAGTGGDAGAGIEFDRVMPGHGQRDGRAQTSVFLHIIALHPVDGCAPAGIVRIQCRPYAGGKCRARGPGVDGVLRAGLAAEKVMIVGINGDASGSSSVNGPKALERPSSGLMDQRLVPIFTSLSASYWPRGTDTCRLAPRMRSCCNRQTPAGRARERHRS